MSINKTMIGLLYVFFNLNTLHLFAILNFFFRG